MIEPWRSQNLRADLEAAGKLIGAYDLLIAAQAIANRLTLITANESEFSRVSGSADGRIGLAKPPQGDRVETFPLSNSISVRIVFSTSSSPTCELIIR